MRKRRTSAPKTVRGVPVSQDSLLLTAQERLADDGWTVPRVPFAEPGIICGEDVDDWLDDWGDGALLFLDHVRTVGYTEEDRSTRRELALKWSEAQHHEAAVGGASVPRSPPRPGRRARLMARHGMSAARSSGCRPSPPAWVSLRKEP